MVRRKGKSVSIVPGFATSKSGKVYPITKSVRMRGSTKAHKYNAKFFGDNPSIRKEPMVNLAEPWEVRYGLKHGRVLKARPRKKKS